MTTTMQQEALLPFHVNFTCPHCSAVRQVPEQYVGQSGTCNACGGAITIDANTAPSLSRVPVLSQPKSWYRERACYFEFCRENYELARAQFPPIDNDAHWQQRIQEAARCENPAEQVTRWDRLVTEEIPWSVAYEYLVHHYVKERDYERAYYYCSVYFSGDCWMNPQCAGGSHTLLKTMRKLDKKLRV